MEKQKENFEEKKETRTANPLSLKRLYSVSESALYLSKGIYSIRVMIWNGDLPIVRDGRRILIDVHDLDRWIEEHKTPYRMRMEDERPNNGRRTS